MKKSLVFVYSLLFTIPAQATLIGVQWDGGVVAIDPTTGDPTTGISSPIGSTGFDRLNSAASNSNGTIYTISQGDAEGVSGTLLTVNPADGTGSIVTTLADGSLNGARGIAFNGQDVLYAVYDTGPFGQTGGEDLYTIDINTGALSLIGPTGEDLQSLAFSADGTLYGWGLTYGLATIDVSTGAATPIDASSLSTLFIQALEFSSDGTLYGIDNEPTPDGTDALQLYRINPRSGSTSLIGVGGGDVRGLAFASPIPVPAAVWLFGSGLLGLIGIARRKKP